MTALTRDGDVYVLNLGDDENRFTPRFLDDLDAALDVVEKEKAEGPRALVTVGTGKFYSNGLDWEWATDPAHPDRLSSYLTATKGLIARVLALPAPTVAALNGHAFGLGAILALAHDYRVMRADRGYFCLPEVDLGHVFLSGAAALIQARLSPNTAHEAMVTGRRYGGEDAHVAGIVHETAAEPEVLPTAVRRAAPLARKDGATVAGIRRVMYGSVLGLLSDPT